MNQWIHFYETWYEHYVIGGNPSVDRFNFRQSVTKTTEAQSCNVVAPLARHNLVLNLYAVNGFSKGSILAEC